MAQLVSIRIESDSVGEMLVASPAIVALIQRILNIPNPIQVNYMQPTPAEDFPGVGPVLNVYHNGFNHFTDKPGGGDL